MLIQALKMFKEVEKHFADFDEDQFDFHSYCIRKMTLRAYVRPQCLLSATSPTHVHLPCTCSDGHVGFGFCQATVVGHPL